MPDLKPLLWNGDGPVPFRLVPPVDFERIGTSWPVDKQSLRALEPVPILGAFRPGWRKVFRLNNEQEVGL